MQDRAHIERSSKCILPRLNRDAVLNLFQTRGVPPKQEIRFRAKNCCFDDSRVLPQNVIAILQRRFVMAFLHQHFSTNVERWPVRRICFDGGLDGSVRASDVAFFEKLVLRLIN